MRIGSLTLAVLFPVCLMVTVVSGATPQTPHESPSVAPVADEKPEPPFLGPHEVPVPPPDGDQFPAAVETSPAGIWTFGGFTAVQANVNAQGLNIVGDAANEPSIAVDPTNLDRMAIGWRHFQTIGSDFRQAGNAYTRDGGQTWTFPGVLTPGQFRSDPVLHSTSDGVFYYYSLPTVSSCDMFKSTNWGQTWTGPVPARGGDKNWMTIDQTGGQGEGNLYINWNFAFTCCGSGDFSRSTDGGQTFLTPVRMTNSPKWGTITVAPNGHVWAAGTSQNQSTFYVTRSTNAQNPGQTPSFDLVRQVSFGGRVRFSGGSVPNPAGLHGQVWIAAPQPGGPNPNHLYALASVGPISTDPCDVRFIRSTDGGDTWSAPARVHDDTGDNWQWFGTLSVASNGRLDVVWNDTRNTGNFQLHQTFYAYSIDAGETWSHNYQITDTWNSWDGFPVQRKIGDYYDMKSTENVAHLAFSATMNGEQDVYYMAITPDCNNNGFHDANDIMTGRSTDCDGDGIPDECQDPPPCDQILPLDFDVERGEFVEGTLEDLFESDDQYVVIGARRPTEIAASSIEISVLAITNERTPSALTFVVETATSGSPTRQIIEMYNYDTDMWDRLDERDGPTSDSITAVRIDTNAGRYINDASGEIAARVGYGDRGVSFPAWDGRFDRIYWTVEQ